jgi:hypothetical protein
VTRPGRRGSTSGLQTTARAEAKQTGPKDSERTREGDEGSAADFGGLGSKQKRAKTERKGGDKKEKVFSIFENQQTNEFKCKIEFKHFKNNASACMQH